MDKEAFKRRAGGKRRSCAARLVPLFLASVMAALPSLADAAPQLVAVIVLRSSPLIAPVFVPVGPAVTQVAPLALSPNAANDGSYFMTTVKVDLTGSTKACFTLVYDGAPDGWTLNVGDDSTNDGFGGGSPGLSSSVAELQILQQVMTMFGVAQGAGIVDTLLTQQLALNNGAFKVCVGDDLVSWGNPSGVLSTTNSKLGFQIPDTAPATGFSPAGNGNRDIFAGFNRVVNGIARNGVGLAQVYITLE